VNLRQGRLLLAKKKTSIEVVPYVCCMQRMQHIFDRQTSKHLLLNCRHYRAEQIKLKEKAQLKNTDTILTLFITKIERIATLKYLKNT